MIRYAESERLKLAEEKEQLRRDIRDIKEKYEKEIKSIYDSFKQQLVDIPKKLKEDFVNHQTESFILAKEITKLQKEKMELEEKIEKTVVRLRQLDTKLFGVEVFDL